MRFLDARSRWVGRPAALATTVVLLLAAWTLPATRAVAASDPVIAAAGDIACDPADPEFHGGAGSSNHCHERYTGDQLETGGYAAVLPLGDEQYECGGADAFAQSYDPAWGAAAVKAISHPAVGNHEYDTSGGTDCGSGAAAYFSYFGAAAGVAGKGWYSFDVGSWHLIALNSNCAKVSCVAGGEQEQWLAQDLAQHPGACTLAYFHHPAFSAGSGAAATNPKVLPFWDDLYAAHADLVLNGHKHNYQRLTQLAPSGTPDPSNGIREIIAGTGGVDLGAPGVTFPGTQSFDGTHFGILELTLHPTGYDWRFVADDGTVGDTGSDACVTESPGGPSLSQHVMAKGGGAVTPAAAWPAPTAGNDLLVAAIGWAGTGSPTAPAGWTLAKKAGGTAIFYRANAPPQSGSLTFGGSKIGTWVLSVMEWNGAAPTNVLDRTASGTSGNTATSTASSGTTQPTSQPVEIAIAAIRTLKATTQSSPTNGFSQVDVGTQGSNTTGFYAKVTSSTGPQGVSVKLGGTAKWRGITATYRGN